MAHAVDLERSTPVSRYTVQQPVDDDGRPIIGPDGRPLFLPHFQLPSFVVFDHKVNVRALGAYAFLQAFVDQSEGELSSSITAADVAARFSVSEETVMRQTDRPKNPLGLVPRLAQTHALVVGPNSIKTRDCVDCGTPMATPCPSACTSRKGRRRIKPRFELATHPPEGFCHPGPLTRWEYYKPKLIAKRLRENGQGREIVPFTQVLAWPALDQTIGLIELGTYVFIAAHTSLADGAMATGEDLFRHAIARRFGWTEGHVSEVTAKLERRRLISKAGLIEGHGHRHGYTGEPASYVVRVMPPAGLMHPGPIRVSEYRAPERITDRQEAVRSVRSVSLQFPRVPSDLLIVDNSDLPQKSTRANEGLWTGESGAVDGEIGDLRTHPPTHPTTHPSPSAQEPQCGSPVPQGGALADGDEDSRAGSGHGLGTPVASPAAPDPLMALVERHVPRSMCKHGQQDQEALAARLRTLERYGFTSEEIKVVFHRVNPESVLNPYAVVADRIKSISRLREHLETVARLRAKAAEASQPGLSKPQRCPVHRTEYVPELSTPAKPFCLLCDQEERREAEEALGKPTTDGETPGPKEERKAVPPPSGLSLVLEEEAPDPQMPDLCGRCHAWTRSVIQIRFEGDQQVEDMLPCPRCHPSMVKNQTSAFTL
ncbi:hypothetical protein NOSIN_00320 [Nocardiopsis sinuspersici]|uniref:Uncharacterized protein n=1 Tax=Nocardiopsis sinuspersici TaxID=501010 RepID=A0A1V3BV92_9ACTN|nr:hypothetical protein NOSIN_00320 [Nocardiopsis sinuspersici]